MQRHHEGQQVKMALSNLDAALHELGMLSTVTQSRQDYLKEKDFITQKKTKLHVAPMNIWHVAHVCSARCRMPIRHHKPYVVPEKVSTKSDELKCDQFCDFSVASDASKLRRSYSLESVPVLSDSEVVVPLQEVETVSFKLQNMCFE